jgi:hypothetical protein
MNEPLKVESMILCKDCKHYKAGNYTYEDICMANAEVDLVRGELYSDKFCMNERDPRRSCRPQALNFVPLVQPKQVINDNYIKKSDILTKRRKV